MIRSLLVLVLAVAGCQPADNAPPGATDLTVMTFNIRYDNPGDGPSAWPNRADWVAETIGTANPDVFGLQEALLHQIEHVAAALPDYRWVGVGRDDGEERGEFSPVFYRANLLELLDTGTWWLSDAPADTGSVGWDAALPRVATVTHFGLRDTGQPLWLINTHFDHLGEVARTQSAALLADLSGALALTGADATGTPSTKSEASDGRVPVVLMGDFNFTEASAGYANLTGSGLQDAFVAAGRPSPSETFTGFDATAGPSGDRIDLVFTSGASVRSYEALDVIHEGRYVSDHRPVVVSLTIP
ncbi:MAG: endonuclease/exonuclease/phosphatase family protein, partial [Rhodothermales bacterium]|nr:endonuclease/exonuclease/phosphatase family protein [Rhodothermales bacterium]